TENTIILAPLHGYTECAFRNALAGCFYGYDEAIAPFISLSPAEHVNPRRLHDLVPSRNSRLTVVPQILGNEPQQFIAMANALADLGYDRLNWNMGCPKKSIASKQRGSGLLPHPELIDGILSAVVPKIPQRLSVKLRLGRSHPEEIYPVIGVLNRFPLETVILHPRIGIEKYEVRADVDRFEEVLPLFKHPVIYNGDIFSWADYNRISDRFRSVTAFMIGRGGVANPFLAEQIKGLPLASAEEQRNRFIHFISVLMDELKKDSKSPHFLFSRMKDYWGFFSYLFYDSEKIYKELVRIPDEETFYQRQEKILNEAIWRDLNSSQTDFMGSKADKKQLEG
ncbi:MAG: tRNA-dihydrouridine synthase family protein, partial [Bacteroidota bacterium]|nr:tRNA-dihydrouridine synthase family protein [Bacteroidota bacterium]